ncbi:MAG TPA: pseudouridine synthase, partial [Bacteroidia bacterium]|nr:pseudouridine synthase [Bacteroidia bacterium]
PRRNSDSYRGDKDSSHFGERKPFKKRFNSDKEEVKKDTGGYHGDKPRRFSEGDKSNFGKRDTFKKRFNSDRPEGEKKYPEKNFNRASKSFSRDDKARSSDSYRSDKPRRSFDSDPSEKPKRSFRKDSADTRNDRKKRFYKKDFSKKKEDKPTFADQGLIRLNKYIANAGICSRREADDLITSGCVTVNGKIITGLGFKVKEGDVVNYSGEHIKTEKRVYLLLNKPKDYITTAEDERGRRTVMELLEGACKERVYPVGRLDRNTTGLLLFTNDGEMTKKLTHPKHNVQKLYHVELDKNLKQTDLLKIREGIELEDGPIKPDEVSYAGESKREVGIQIHSGRNRVVRRIFESMGYEVIKLDRVMFAGLTKKNLPKGRWRFLNEQEVSFLKMV